MKVLITGAFGNLGVMCIEQALSMGYSVKCFDLKTPNNEKVSQSFLKNSKHSDEIEIIWGDIRELHQQKNLLIDVSGIIHNACLLPPLTENQPEQAWDINVNCTKQLIALAESQSHKIRFIYPSSVTVYGFAHTNETPKHASDETQATDNYTQHKLACEYALNNAQLEWSILRVGVSVDHRTTKTDFGTLKTLLKVSANNPLEYVHPKDVALAMCRALSNHDAIYKTLLIGGGRQCQITQSDFLNGSLNGLGLELAPKNFGHNSYYTHWMDTCESQQILQYQHHSFNDYQKEMANTFKTFKTILTPIRPLANWFLNAFVSRLSKA